MPRQQPKVIRYLIGYPDQIAVILEQMTSNCSREQVGLLKSRTMLSPLLGVPIAK